MDIPEASGADPREDDPSLPGQDVAQGSIEPSDDDILRDAQARLELASEAETEIRKHALNDLEFLSGDQWPKDIQQERDRENRPCLTINRLPQLAQQVTNDQRQNRPAIKVHAVGDGAKEETADVFQGMIRHIEYVSDAENAYDTAFEAAVESSRGFFRILSEYSDPESFDQEVKIGLIKNALSVFFDPYSQMPDGSDAKWAFIVEDLSPEEYKAQYPNSELASSDMAWDAIGSQAPGWIKEKQARVAEYFYIEMREETLHLLSTGEVVKAEDLQSRLDAVPRDALNNPTLDVRPVKTRTTKIPVVNWCKLNGIEILDRGVCPGRYIPVIPVYGKDRTINGKRVLESLIRHAKDPQRMLNYWKSAETETIALAPKAPYIAAEGQIEGYKEIWEDANRRNLSVLPYKPSSIAGTPVPPPQRQNSEPAVQAITQAGMGAGEDIKSTTGVYDAGVGNDSSEISGAAIQKRATQVQTANFHFADNMKRSMKHGGRILLDWIPAYYDTARAQRIIGDDGTHSIVKINQPYQDESGQTKHHNLTIGKYDVTIDTGPSFQTKRQEAAAGMLDLSKSAPQIWQLAGDILVKNMDWPGAEELSERLKLALPPQLQNDGKQPQVPPQAMALIQQQHQMINGQTAKINELSKIVETQILQLQHKERVEMAKIQADLEINAAKLNTQGAIALMQQQIAELMQREKLLGANQPIAAPDNFNASQADGGNFPLAGHVGGSPTGGASPGSPMEGQPSP